MCLKVYKNSKMGLDFCLNELYANVKQAKVHLDGLLPFGL